MPKYNTLRALWLLTQHGAVDRDRAIGSRRFAELMWPATDERFRDNWARVSNIGHGSTRGVGMWRAGGSFLARLAKDGYVFNRNATESGSLPAYYLTLTGITALERSGFDPNRPQRLSDAVDRLQVRLRRDVATTGGDRFPAGTVFTVVNHWRGRLNLSRVGSRKDGSGLIRRVSLRDVEFLPHEDATEAAMAVSTS